MISLKLLIIFVKIIIMKVSTIKKIQLLLLLFALQFCTAQILPKLSYQDYGYTKPVSKIEIIYYSFKDKVVIDKKKEVFLFNKDGKIEKIQKENYDDNSKSEINYFYKNGLLTKETHISKEALINKENLAENSELIYEYNKDKKVIATYYKSQNYTKTYHYKYNGKNLVKAVGESDGEKFEENYLYDKKNNLYKLNRTYSSGKVNLNKTSLYLKGVEIGSYSEKYEDPYLVFKNEKAEIYYNIISSKGLIKLKNLENELMLGNDFEREDLNSQIYQLAQKKVDAKFSFGNINLNKDGNIVANAELKKNGEDPEFVSFRKIYFADGSELGTADFDIFVYNEIKNLLKN